MYFYSNNAVNKDKPSYPSSNMTEKSTAAIDAFHVGSHCQLKSCNRLDFLPWKCDRCKLKFCEDHRKYESHQCSVLPPPTTVTSKQSTTLQPSRPNVFQSLSCYQKDCKTLLNTTTSPATECVCHQLFCLKHRHPQDHNCPGPQAITKKSALLSNSETTLTKETLLLKLKEWSSNRKSTSSTGRKGSLLKGLIRTKSNQSASPIVQRGLAVSQLRKEAKGDTKTPEPNRIYINGEGAPNLGADGTLTSATQMLRKPVFFSKEWSNGKVLDKLAETLGVQNMNSSTGDKEKRLQLFHIESGTLLEMERKFGEVVKNGDTVVIARGW